MYNLHSPTLDITGGGERSPPQVGVIVGRVLAISSNSRSSSRFDFSFVFSFFFSFSFVSCLGCS